MVLISWVILIRPRVLVLLTPSVTFRRSNPGFPRWIGVPPAWCAEFGNSISGLRQQLKPNHGGCSGGKQNEPFLATQDPEFPGKNHQKVSRKPIHLGNPGS